MQQAKLKAEIRKELFSCKSVMVGRKPRAEGDTFKTAVIALFDQNNPHKIGAAPIKAMDFPNMEKVRIRDMNVSYYLEGNDIVINDLHEVELEINEEKRKIILRGKQDVVEERVP